MAEKELSWSKPQLIVLGRGLSEERVLVTCKHQQLSGPGDSADVTGCSQPGVSKACQNRAVT
jgi:hypothetical protein